MTDPTRRTLLVAGASLLATIAAKPSRAFAETSAKPIRGGSLTASIGYPEPQAMFVPSGGGGSPSFTASKVLERLIRLNADQTFSPQLAESWSSAPDFQSFTIHLRQGVTWHDGKDFTADDVAFSIVQYWRVLTPGGILKELDDVDILDRQTVRVRFKRPVPEFSFLSTIELNYIIPKHIYESGNIVLNPANIAPIGTGPWKFKKWVRGSYAEFTPNEHYWIPGQPYLDRLIIRWWRDPASRAAALESGELGIGVTNPAPLGDLKRLQQNPELALSWDGSGNSIGVSLYFNNRNPILAKREVRQALLHAVDRKFIVDTIYFGFAKLANSPIFSSNPRFFTDDVPRYDYDPAKAAKLLDLAGYPVQPDGKRFEVNFLASGWSEENGKVGAYVKQVLDDLKIPTKLRVPDRPNSLKALYTDYDFDIAYSQGGGGQPDPVPLLTQLYTKDGIAKGVPFRNATGYASPEMDALVNRLTYEVDPEKRRAQIGDFARLAVTDAPMFPLVEWTSHILARKSVHITPKSNTFSTEGWGDVWVEA